MKRKLVLFGAILIPYFSYAESNIESQFPFEFDWESVNKTEKPLNLIQATNQQKYDGYQDEEKLVYKLPELSGLREPATSGESDATPPKESLQQRTD